MTVGRDAVADTHEVVERASVQGAVADNHEVVERTSVQGAVADNREAAASVELKAAVVVDCKQNPLDVEWFENKGAD